VVSQPDSGLVLAKSFYRILGTIAGVLVTIALVFGLSQYGDLFVAARSLAARAWRVRSPIMCCSCSAAAAVADDRDNPRAGR